MICNRTPSTIADHIKPHRCNFTLFFDDKNLQGVCKTCHDIKTATEDGGFGNPRLVGPRPEVSRAVATGERGKQFQASSVRAETVAKALAYDKDELLKGIPE
jgi:5-methylcytosine-specific restriction endonuclease McrA